MLTPAEKLAFQVKHMLISDEDKERLVNEIASLDENKLQELAQMIAEHDKEVIGIVRAKVSEEKESYEQLKQSLPPHPAYTQEINRAVNELSTALQDPVEFGKYLAVKDDVTVSVIEEVILKASQDNPQRLKDLQEFFQELWLQKSAFNKKATDQMKETIMELITARQEKIGELNSIIAEAQKAMEDADK